MSRPLTKGLRYAYLDVSFFQDRKVRKLQRKCGESAPLVYIGLLCTIFPEGYYVSWDEDFSIDLAERIHMDEEFVDKCIRGCMEVGLLSKEVFDKYHVVTSHGIQKQYQLICEQNKRKNAVNEYSLLMDGTEEPSVSPEFLPNNSEEIRNNPEETPENPDFPTRIEENRIEKNRIEKNSFSSSSSPSPFVAVDPSEEEKEKQEFLSCMFFKDWASPGKELEKFIAYNNLNGRNWEKMTYEERHSALHLWKQEPAQPPRLGKDFLALWRQVDITLGQHNASWELRMDALSDGIRWDIHGNRMVLSCSQRLAEFIERHMDTLKPYIVRFLRSGKWNDQTFTYKFIQPWYP